RDGYMRVLRNLNPRYEAESWIPAGTRLNATVKVAGLYQRWCTQGPRAELARQRVNSDPATAVVRVGNVQSMPTDGGPWGAAVAAPGPAPARPREHRVQRGETLVSIARKY